MSAKSSIWPLWLGRILHRVIRVVYDYRDYNSNNADEEEEHADEFKHVAKHVVHLGRNALPEIFTLLNVLGTFVMKFLHALRHLRINVILCTFAMVKPQSRLFGYAPESLIVEIRAVLDTVLDEPHFHVIRAHVFATSLKLK